MKANRLFLIVALLLGVFFLSQAAAEICFLVGPGPVPGKKFKATGFDAKGFSLSSRLFTETAFALIENLEIDANEPAVRSAMTLLRKALRRNPLDYQARYYLAKAYLQFSAVDNDYFDLGVRELKRAARIRGSNKQIALDCGRVFFSLWPFLEEGDKAFALDLLARAMPGLSWPEFKPLVELWAFYVQDAPLLMELLNKKPDFFGPAADLLVVAAIPIEQRRQLLALHEVHTLDRVERRFNELSLQGEIGLADMRSLLAQLRSLKGFYRLQPESGFSPEKYLKLQRFLLLGVLEGLLGAAQYEADAKTTALIRETIAIYIADHPGLGDLDELQKTLIEKNYFRENDFSSLYLKTLIIFKKGSYNDIIVEIESLRKTISFVKKEQLADYTNILLLLVDSYYSSKLLTAAEAVARELYQNQPDNADVLYRVLRIQKILGDEGKPDPELNARLANVENSRFLTVAKANSSFEVFLFNQPEIEIVFDPVWLASLKPKQLLQVYVDGKIAFESYVDAVPGKVVFGKPFVDVERKVKVQVTVVQ